MKQTAMQQFIEELKQTLEKCQPEFEFGIKHAILRASAHLPEERQQIIDAHLTGLIYPLEKEATQQATEYFTETYGE